MNSGVPHDNNVLVDIKQLTIRFPGSQHNAVQSIDLEIRRGEVLALVGESGSGKSVTAHSLLRLLPANTHTSADRLMVCGTDVLRTKSTDDAALRHLRGNRIGMIFQEPMTALNPLHRIGRQIAEAIDIHHPQSTTALRKRVLELLKLVALPDPEQKIDRYPHELSGGQRQRVMIAMALANSPDILIADEPTTALDVHVQKQILDLIIDLKNRLGMAVLLISHDLNLVRRHADRVAVMRQGEIVETADTENIFSSPHHEYTQRLLAAEPRGEPTPVAPESPVLLSVKNLRAWFPIYHGVFRRVAGHVKAATDIKFELRAGQTLGIVGESGSGKSTTALAVLRLIEAEGSVNFRGQELMQLSPKNLRELRRHIQIVFQDPYGSLSPRMTVGDIINEGLRVHEHLDNDACAARIAEVLREVGLESAMADRYPHEFSGGQRQRIAIARALILKPELVVLDEPTSALDRTIQAQIVDLLRDLQRRHGLTYMVISHDLRTVRALAHEILVMKDGLIIEQGSVEQIFSAPHEEYTRQLLAAAFD